MLPEMRTSFDLPERIALRVDLYPNEYLPDLMTRASFELMLSADFLTFF